ncbi:MAG TPA: hypothetical protein VEB21_19450 [Terriglobales bacterium]|nr:hypothetical protein [Terriglobales bacterium]
MANPANPMKGKTFQSGKENKGRKNDAAESSEQPKRSSRHNDSGPDRGRARTMH